MTCHNGSPEHDYAGPGLENPHPFPGADNLRCTTCHGGNPNGEDQLASHVPPPPEIGDEAFQAGNGAANRKAYFNRLTLTGIDKFPDYTVGGKTYTALDYLQFVNPGDLRVVTANRSCGQCHQGHAECVGNSLLATSAGILSGAMYAIGVDNEVPTSQGLDQDTAADKAFRAVQDDNYVANPNEVGFVDRLLEFPVFSVFGQNGDDDIFRNDDYDSDDLVFDQLPDNKVVTGSKLANLYHEQVAFTCGDCHLGSAGANNRYGDFRSSGCTSCHMPYSRSGRTGTTDPNIPTNEPADVDQIDAPERAHVKRHLITSIAKTLTTGEFVRGIDDHACAGCHQGSNRTVMQYWGIRLDQNEDVKDGNQYPANPAFHFDTRNDTRLFDPVVDNDTFNGRRAAQYLLYEDYDNDGRDDTPPDVHHAAGMGCIDCHGSYDLHGGNPAAGDTGIPSRMEQAVAIECESCHGSAAEYAPTQVGADYNGDIKQLAMDRKGNLLRHVHKEPDGQYYMTSRLTGNVHYVMQTKDTVVDSGVTHPFTGNPVYSERASYAMGRADGDPSTGIGPRQHGDDPSHAFSHGDNLSCAACHSSWTNSCIGCHLEGEYTENNNTFSNITGDRIVFRERNADFVYQTPVHFQLGIGPKGKVVPFSPNTETFFQYRDRHDTDSKVFAFTDRNGGGNNPANAPHPALSHNAIMPHSIRGKIGPVNEGPRYCVSCHLTTDGLAMYGAEYDQLRTAMSSPTLNGMTVPFFQTLQEHIGENTGNQMNSPLWVHMVAGLGSGLYLFDENGCPINPLDDNDNRAGCDGTSPQDSFDLARVVFNLDRLVDPLTGISTGSNNHALLDPLAPSLRDGALNEMMSGPLGMTMVNRLTDPVAGIVLNAWLNANADLGGNAGDYITGP